jgi:chromosome segregation ATPase
MADNDQRLSVVESELSQLARAYNKLDMTIEKLTDVNSSIQQLLAVHDNKLETHRSTDQELYRLIETKKADTEAKLAELRRELGELEEGLNTYIEERMKEFRKDLHDESKETARRLSLLEKWKWIAIGGAIAVGHMLTKLGSLVNLK